jgi:hypothetical protein
VAWAAAVAAVGKMKNLKVRIGLVFLAGIACYFIITTMYHLINK